MKNQKTSYQTHEEHQSIALDRLINNQIEKLHEHQKPAVLKFKDHLILQGISKPRIRGYMGTISRLLRQTGKTTEELTKEDIEQFLLSVKDLNQRTKFGYFQYLKMFLRWMGKEHYVQHINLKDALHVKLPEEILTLEEIKRMVHVATNFRDKALIFTLYETAARRGEFLRLRIKHVNFDDKGARITIPKGKTVSRKLRVFDCVPALKEWIDCHPGRDDREAPLWINVVTHRKKALADSGLKSLVDTIAQRAGIKKKVYPHLFRHSRLTELAKLGLNESALRILAGWANDSKMPKVYIHMSGGDVETKLLELHGLIDKEKEEKARNVLRPIICWRCKEENGATTRFCGRCGADLDEEKRKEEKIIFLKGAKNVDITKADEMIALGKKLIEQGRLAKE